MPQLSTEQATQLRPGLRTLQLITLAMVMTQFLFLAVIMAAINTDELHSDLKMLIFLAARHWYRPVRQCDAVCSYVSQISERL